MAIRDIENIFSVFHDAGISGFSGDMTSLMLKIDCIYLAELINPGYSFFYVELLNVIHFSLQTWSNPIDLPVEYFIKPEEIFQAELEILSADIKDNIVEVSCNQHDTNFDYHGGVLRISASQIKVYDEEKRQISIDELSSISHKYWNTFR